MNVDLQLFSPRWGHDDVYRIELERDHLEVTMQGRIARADYRENFDPVWSGESIERIMRNDNIWPPAHVQDFFERVWLAWRNGDLDDAGAANELQELANWINAISRAKPRTHFWRGHF